MKRTSMPRIVLAMCIIVLGTACADAEPMAPDIGTPAFNTTGMEIGSIARFNTGAPGLLVGMAWTWIGPEGGSLRLLDFEIVVPPGAVTKATRFSIRLPVNPGEADHAFAHFGPHNVTFHVPVTIRTPLRGTSAEGSMAHILWWDGTAWIPFPTTFTSDGRIETQTTHFSTYGTEETLRGITVAGG